MSLLKNNMKIFIINHTQISVASTNVWFWIWIADKHLRFLKTKHLQCKFFLNSLDSNCNLEIMQNCFMDTIHPSVGRCPTKYKQTKVRGLTLNQGCRVTFLKYYVF